MNEASIRGWHEAYFDNFVPCLGLQSFLFRPCSRVVPQSLPRASSTQSAAPQILVCVGTLASHIWLLTSRRHQLAFVYKKRTHFRLSCFHAELAEHRRSLCFAPALKCGLCTLQSTQEGRGFDKPCYPGAARRRDPGARVLLKSSAMRAQGVL